MKTLKKAFGRNGRAAIPGRHKFWTVMLLTGLLTILVFGIGSAAPAGGWNIDGNVPDGGTVNLPDPEGNTKELGPENGNTTKISVIHNDPLPTLNLTNPNNQVDLKDTWIGVKTDPDTGYIWLYFGWWRESTSGSGFISLELGQNAAPALCDYSQSDDYLIANCNPWANRADGDTLFLWDQQGNSLEIEQRTFDASDPSAPSWGTPTTLNSDQAVAKYSPAGDRGEVAINLSLTVFTPGECQSIANVIPGTVTGNSDNADYKDTVLGDTGINIANCGSITIVKDAVPNSAQDFSYTSDISGSESFTLDDDSGAIGEDGTYQNSIMIPNVLEGTYNVTETVPTGWILYSLKCVSTDGSTDVSTFSYSGSTATINLTADDDVTCTYVNQALGEIIIDKVTDPAGDSQAFDFTLTGGASSLNDSFQLTDAATPYSSGPILAGNGYSAAEINLPAGWEAPTSSCSDGSPVNNIDVAPGETVTCTFYNTKQGTVIINKVTQGADGTFAYTGTGEDIDASFNIATTGNSGSKTFNNVTPGAKTVTEDGPPAGWSFVSLACSDPDNGTSTSGQTANIDLDAGETVTCTYTNEATGAIKVVKTAKHAASESGSISLPGADFSFTGPDSASGTTDANGEVCVDGLSFGSYTVSETGVPTGYAGAADQNVLVDTVATCNEATYVGEVAYFSNTPLTDISWSVDSQVDGGTSTVVDCKDGTGASLPGYPVTVGDGSDSLPNLLPTDPDVTVTCTFTVDP